LTQCRIAASETDAATPTKHAAWHARHLWDSILSKAQAKVALLIILTEAATKFQRNKDRFQHGRLLAQKIWEIKQSLKSNLLEYWKGMAILCGSR